MQSDWLEAGVVLGGAFRSSMIYGRRKFDASSQNPSVAAQLKIMEVPIYSAFAATYRAEHLDPWPPAGANITYYPETTNQGGHDGVLVRCVPLHADEWIGCFAFGGGGATGIYTCPNPQQLLIASSGNMFLLRAQRPTNLELFQDLSAQTILQVAEVQLLLYSNVIEIVALSASGIVWTNRDLSTPRIRSVNGNVILGVSEDCGTDVNFEIDLASGKLIRVEPPFSK